MAEGVNSGGTKRLILKGIPQDIDPNHDLLFSVANYIHDEDKYDLFSDITLTYPLSLQEQMETGRLTSNYALHLIDSVFVDKFNALYAVSKSAGFWEYVLYPAIVTIIQFLYERQQMVMSVYEQFGRMPVEVELMTDNLEWSIESTAEFQAFYMHDPNFNHWVLSRIIEVSAPANWLITYTKGVVTKPPVRKKSLMMATKEALRRTINFMAPRVSNIYGLNPLEIIMLSTLLSQKKSVPRPEVELGNNRVKPEIKWVFNELKMLERIFPTSKFHIDASHFLPPFKTQKKSGKVRLFSNDLYYNNASKIKAAKAHESGELIGVVQHGGYLFGTGYINEVIRNIELRNDFFISWGWSGYYKDDNIIPLPSPHLVKHAGKYKRKSNDMILVGTSAKYYNIRYSAGLPPEEIFNYRADKISFLESLDQQVRENVLYKPYPSQTYMLEDEKYMSANVPGLRVYRKKLVSKMLETNLLLLDHPGTTLAFAMVANIPTVLFFRDEYFTHTPEAERFYSELANVGMFHRNAKGAAAFVNKNYAAVDLWWQTEVVQSARRSFINEYLDDSPNWRSKWFRFFREI